MLGAYVAKGDHVRGGGSKRKRGDSERRLHPFEGPLLGVRWECPRVFVRTGLEPAEPLFFEFW